MTPAEIIAARRDAVVLPSDVWRSWFDRLRAGQLPAYQRAALQVTTTLRPLQGLECVDVIRLMSGLDHDVAGVGCPGLLGVPVAGLIDGDATLEPILARKVRGEVLSSADIHTFVSAVADNRASDSQVAAFCMAVYLRGMSDDETVALTSAQVDTGETLDLMRQGSRAPVVDKHSTGGVGDKVSLPLAAVLATCGARVPMISGRGLGHTGGTLDKLQSIPGFRVDLSRDEIVDVVGRVGVVITGQTAHLAPSDRRMYAIRDVTATVSSIPLITASILSKKLAEGLDFLLMDVKVGSGAFLPSEEDARRLATSLVGVAQGLGRLRGGGDLRADVFRPCPVDGHGSPPGSNDRKCPGGGGVHRLSTRVGTAGSTYPGGGGGRPYPQSGGAGRRSGARSQTRRCCPDRWFSLRPLQGDGASPGGGRQVCGTSLPPAPGPRPRFDGGP